MFGIDLPISEVASFIGGTAARSRRQGGGSAHPGAGVSGGCEKGFLIQRKKLHLLFGAGIGKVSFPQVIVRYELS